MTNTSIFILAILDYIAELITLTYQAGSLARKIIIPTVVFMIICGEYIWTEVSEFYYSHTFTLEKNDYKMAFVDATHCNDFWDMV